MIELRRVSKRYGAVEAVHDLSFSAPTGQIVGLLGQNGAGKTTTLNMLTGYFPPTSGQVLVDGKDMLRYPRACKRAIGYLPEKPPLYDEMTVTAYLTFVCRLKEVASRAIPKHIEEIMHTCGLTEVRERLVGHLSKGYRQRVGVAQALCGNPPVLVLDEPTVGLDPRQVVEIRELMRELGGYDVELCRFGSLPDKTQAFLEKYFMTDVLPLLSPQIVGRKQPFPFLRNKSIYAIASLKSKDGTVSMGIVPCEDGVLPRLVSVPGEGRRFVLMEELILGFLPKVFARCKVEESVLVRLVRSADIEVDDSAADADDLLPEEYRKRMEKLIRRRKKLSPVKLEYKGRMSDPLRSNLSKLLGLSKKHMFAGSVPLDLSLISLLRDQLREDTTLFYPRRVPQDSPAVSLRQSVTEQIRRADILLAYPYESIRPLLRLLREAGRDP